MKLVPTWKNLPSYSSIPLFNLFINIGQYLYLKNQYSTGFKSTYFWKKTCNSLMYNRCNLRHWSSLPNFDKYWFFFIQRFFFFQNNINSEHFLWEVNIVGTLWKYFLSLLKLQNQFNVIFLRTVLMSTITTILNHTNLKKIVEFRNIRMRMLVEDENRKLRKM